MHRNMFEMGNQMANGRALNDAETMWEEKWSKQKNKKIK